MIRGLDDMSYEARLKELNLLIQSRGGKGSEEGLLSSKKKLVSNQKDDGAKFFLVIAYIIKKGNGRKLGGSSWALRKKKCQNGNATLQQMTQKGCGISDLGDTGN